MENKDSIEDDTNDFDAMTAMMVGLETELERAGVICGLAGYRVAGLFSF